MKQGKGGGTTEAKQIGIKIGLFLLSTYSGKDTGLASWHQIRPRSSTSRGLTTGGYKDIWKKGMEGKIREEVAKEISF